MNCFSMVTVVSWVSVTKNRADAYLHDPNIYSVCFGKCKARESENLRQCSWNCGSPPEDLQSFLSFGPVPQPLLAFPALCTRGTLWLWSSYCHTRDNHLALWNNLPFWTKLSQKCLFMLLPNGTEWGNICYINSYGIIYKHNTYIYNIICHNYIRIYIYSYKQKRSEGILKGLPSNLLSQKNPVPSHWSCHKWASRDAAR